MSDRGASAPSLPDDWPAHPDPILALNRMGSFDWDLDAGLFHMDAQAHEVFDLRPEEYDGAPSRWRCACPRRRAAGWTRSSRGP